MKTPTHAAKVRIVFWISFLLFLSIGSCAEKIFSQEPKFDNARYFGKSKIDTLWHKSPGMEDVASKLKAYSRGKLIAEADFLRIEEKRDGSKYLLIQEVQYGFKYEEHARELRWERLYFGESWFYLNDEAKESIFIRSISQLDKIYPKLFLFWPYYPLENPDNTKLTSKKE